MKIDSLSVQLFFALVKGGLWEKEVSSPSLKNADLSEVKRLAQEQSLMGLVAAGLTHLKDVTFTDDESVPYIGKAMRLEKKNAGQNAFIAKLSQELHARGISFVMVKGQGVAQCYEKPSWRSCGDVDLLLDEENYQKAKVYLAGIARNIHEENLFDKHYSAEIDGWLVELHGSLRSMLTKRADSMIDAVQEDTFVHRHFRFWDNGGTSIPLPCADNDVIFVFTHILKHFFHYGIGLRQVCDWCRLLYCYQSVIDKNLLENRLRSMGLMSEWKAFGALAVDWLGMPQEAMPFYSPAHSWKRKARRILSFVLDTGNFGHKRDNTYLEKYPGLLGKVISFTRHTCDSIRHSFIFPVDAIRIWGRMVGEGIKDFVH